LVGGGVLFTNKNIPGTSSKIRGTYGAGLGLELIDWFDSSEYMQKHN
jgi:hypothetical protein